MPGHAFIFLQEFEEASKSGSNVSLWERVVFSLIEAKDRTEDGHAPHTEKPSGRAWGAMCRA